MNCKLSTLMGAARLTIEDVHKKTGLSRCTITTLYHDKATRIDFHTVQVLCDYFGCGIEDLFELSEKAEEK